MQKLYSIVFKIKEDFMKSPTTMKILVALLVIAAIFGACAGLGYGPSKDFIVKMDKRAKVHFPRYRELLDKSDPKLLGNILGIKDLEKAQELEIKDLRMALKREVDAWEYLIRKNLELVKKIQPDSEEQKNE